MGLCGNFALSALSEKCDKKVSIAQLKTRGSALKISKWRRTRRKNFNGVCAMKRPSDGQH